MNRVFEKKYLLIISIVVIFSVLFFAVFNSDEEGEEIASSSAPSFSSSEQLSSSVHEVISGTVYVNGYIPSGSKVQVFARKSDESSFISVATLTAAPQVGWMWTGAEKSVPYELKAILKTPKEEFSSGTSTVIAPANHEKIDILSQATPDVSSYGKIGGKIAINGVIPSGATVTLFQRPQGSVKYITFGENILAANGVDWQWNSAKVGTTYEVMATLNFGGQVLGTSTSLVTSAPTANQVLSLNSSVVAPGQEVAISGTIDLNGTIPPKSTVSLGVREVGMSSFQNIGSNISATDGVAWSWDKAESGKVYELQAYVVMGTTPIAQSEIISVNAPATDQVLTMNVSYQAAAPSTSSLGVSCVAKDSKNKWQVKLTMNDDEKLKGVGKYWLKFGTVNGSGEFIDSQIVPLYPDKSESITTDYILTPNTTYYARYAYENCDCGIFSSFTPPVQVSCKN